RAQRIVMRYECVHGVFNDHGRYAMNAEQRGLRKVVWIGQLLLEEPALNRQNTGRARDRFVVSTSLGASDGYAGESGHGLMLEQLLRSHRPAGALRARANL